MTHPDPQVGLADNVLSSELRIYKEARDGNLAFKGTVDSKYLPDRKAKIKRIQATLIHTYVNKETNS